ncbi:MAG: ABC transporter substrate-binding protein [Pseudomonadota bacterium]|nr:ABC transporter substrate-binding protein [Pseudomonadota bacterium]
MVKALAALAAGAALCVGGEVRAKPLKLEKEQIKLGFIKLTDMVPLAIAYEKGYFEDEGLYVTLEAQSNWKVVLDRVISGELDGSHMLMGQPLGATIGIGTKADMYTVYSMAINGKGITISNDAYDKIKATLPKDAAGKVMHPVSAKVLMPVVEDLKKQGKPFKMGIVFPVSSHNYSLRYWLAAGGLSPGYYSASDVSGQINADVLLSVTPPPQMPATMEAGTISGYCVGEPWNQQAIFKNVGVPIATDDEFFDAIPDKVFGVTKAWAEKNPNTLLAITKALIRAGLWLDANNGANRKEAAAILSRPEYVGADVRVISKSLLNSFEYGKGDVRQAPNFNVFSRGYASYPFVGDGVWTLTQMRRWGQIEQKPDGWYADTAKKVNRVDIYMQAAQMLIDEGKAKKQDFPFDGDGYRAPWKSKLDGVEFDGQHPNAYVDKFAIGLKGSQQIQGGVAK